MPDFFDQMVAAERLRQNQRWGEQNHTPEIWLAILVEEVGEIARAMLEYRFNEAAKEDIGSELIQSAAVLHAIWESGRRNGWL